MLPMMILQPSDLATADTGLNSSSLLPQTAREPSAAFADVLRMGLEPGASRIFSDGIALPQDGNALPSRSLDELPPLTEQPSEDAVIALPQALQVEPMPPVPLVVAGAEMLNGPASTQAQRTDAALNPLAARGLQQLSDVVLPAGSLAAQQNHELPTSAAREPIESALLHEPPRATPLRPPALNELQRELAAAQLAGSATAPLPDESRVAAKQKAPEAVIRTAMGSDTSPQDLVETVTDGLPRELRPQPATTLVPQTVPAMPAVTPVEAPVPQPNQFTVLQTGAAPTQPAAESPAVSAQLTQSIDVPVREPAWGERIGERVLLMANNRLQNAEIRLTPAELGPLRVQVAVDDGAANVTFLAQHAVTRDAIEQALPRLRDLLADNGLTLNQTSVGQSGGEGVQQGNRDSTDSSAAAIDTAADAAADAIAGDHAETTTPRSRPDSLVDTFV